MKNKGNNFNRQKFAEAINRQLADILHRTVKDKRIGLVSINEVRLTNDLSVAKIYVTRIDNVEKKQLVAKQLNDMAGFLRTELAAKFKSMRTVPELRFYDDTVAESGREIDELLDKINKEQ